MPADTEALPARRRCFYCHEVRELRRALSKRFTYLYACRDRERCVARSLALRPLEPEPGAAAEQRSPRARG